jgi:hypothetical protein
MLGLPKQPFYPGSPSRLEKEAHEKVYGDVQKSKKNSSNKLQFSRQSSSPVEGLVSNIRGRVQLQKIKNGLNNSESKSKRMSKTISIQPNSLDFKDLNPSSLLDNNLLMFRKVRQSKGVS